MQLFSYQERKLQILIKSLANKRCQMNFIARCCILLIIIILSKRILKYNFDNIKS